jgi:hypothetical protein
MRVNDQIVNALKKIKNLPEGEAIFNNTSSPDSFKAALDKFLPGADSEMVELRKRIVEAFGLSAYIRLSKAAEAGDISAEQLQVIDALRAGGIDEALARDIVEAFAALFEHPSATNTFDWHSEEPVSPPPPPPVTGIAADILQDKKRNLQFGNYEWRVLDVQGDEALMMTEDIIEQRCYNNAWAETTWETCELRKYLNGEFLEKFTEEERGKIIEKQINNPDNLWYGTQGGRNTADKVFLLSIEGVDRYFGNSGDYQNKRRKRYDNGKWIADSSGNCLSNTHDGDRQATFRNRTCWWWLLSPGYRNYRAAYVNADGSAYVMGIIVRNDFGGVRPVFWLNLKS